MSPEYLKAKVREVKDFPIPGILFKDITPHLFFDSILDHIRKVIPQIRGLFKIYLSIRSIILCGLPQD